MEQRKPLLEALKELENPACNIPFDDFDDEITQAQVNFIAVENQGDTAKSFGNLREKVQRQESDPKYFGQKITRKSLNNHDNDKETDEEEDSGPDDEDIHTSDSGNEDNVGDSKDEADFSEVNDDGHVTDNEGMGDYEEDNYVDYNDYADDDRQNSSYDDASENEDLAQDSDNEIQIDFSKLPNDLKNQVSISRGDSGSENEAFEHFTELNLKTEASKGRATKAQLDLLDKLVESRIRLQKSLQLTNRLPQCETLKDFKQQASTQVAQEYTLAKRSAKNLLTKLLELQEFLLQRITETKQILSVQTVKTTGEHSDEEIPSDTDNEKESGEEVDENANESKKNGLDLPSKRKHTLNLSDFEEEISKRHKAYNVYQEATIDKWYEKTRLTTGNFKKQKFNAFEKSTTQQIKQVLLDKPRLIKRTQLRRTPYEIIGKTKVKDIEQIEVEDIHLKRYDENIFDDGDLYQEMLKELIERKVSVNTEDPVVAGRQWLELQKLRTKIKRKIDTRASKGRKIRYDVHSKLVSFMAPQNVGTMPNQARNDLFASLFVGPTPHPVK